jgi:hypothetical protein
VRENFGEHLKILIDISIIYYITQFKHSEISIFRKTAVMNNRKYQIYVPGLYSWEAVIEECFSDVKNQK